MSYKLSKQETAALFEKLAEKEAGEEPERS